MAKEVYGVAVQGAAGFWGEQHLAAYIANPKAEVVAMCDIDADAAKARAKALGLSCKIYTDLDQTLADKDVEILSIATPSSYHAKDAALAMQAGKHVLVEKPIATTLEDLALLKRTVAETEVKTMAGFVGRWIGVFVTLKALMKDRVIGDVFMAQADFWQNISWLDIGMNKWIDRKGVAGSPTLAGGCHALDAVRWLLGGAEVEEVFAYSVSGTSLAYDYDPTTLGLMRLDSGALCKLASTLEPCAPYLFRVELLGTEGTIRNNQVYSSRWRGQHDYTEIPTDVPGLSTRAAHSTLDEAMKQEISHFIECIDNDVESHANLPDAIKTHEALMAVDLSAAEGRPVSLPLI
jgi:predicted dehydrogenase